MEKKVNLYHPEDDTEVLATVTLLEIDWYNQLQDLFEQYLMDDNEDLSDFVNYVKENGNLKIKL